MSLAKTLAITESKALVFRIEAFNVFNHAQFYGPTSVDGNINDKSPDPTQSTFGRVVSSAPGRVMQVSAKFNF